MIWPVVQQSNIRLRAVHIAGTENTYADTLSRRDSYPCQLNQQIFNLLQEVLEVHDR